MPSGDARIDEPNQREAQAQRAEQEGRCGPDAKGDVVLLDARTAGPLTCALVTVSMVPSRCSAQTQCASEVVFRGRTNRRGEFALPGPVSQVRLEAVSDGFGAGSAVIPALGNGRVAELEMPPAEGFWLKLLDPDGNYLQDVLVTFKVGDETLAQLRSNNLANVFFTQRSPFSGQEISVEAEGFQRARIGGAEDLGDDGHTLTLRR